MNLSGVVIEDLLGAVCIEIRRTALRLADGVAALQTANQEALDATGDMDRQEAAGDVLRRAHRIEGHVLQAMSALLELQLQAGRLVALATVRHVSDALHDWRAGVPARR